MQLRLQLTRTRVLTASLALAVLAACGCRRAETAGTGTALTVYVPCGMELPFMAAEKAFEAANPGVNVTVVLDNANVLVKRILEKNEKPDLIVSPGTVEMEALTSAGLLDKADITAFGQYELVLFCPRENPAGISTIQDLVKDEVKVIAIAEPGENSVGRYTQQALEAMELWEQLKPKMLFTDHPITAYKHVARNKAEASFAYRSCPLKTAPDKLEYSKVRILESVPQDLYGPATANIAILKETPQRDLAATFVAFLRSPEGQGLLKEYDVPPMPEQAAVHVFVPCGMMSAFLGLKRMYEEQTPNTEIQLEFDRGDILTERIASGQATPDVHLSIGHVERDLLVQAGRVAEADSKPFGAFQLALCTHVSKTDLVKTLADLARPEVEKIVLTPVENSSVGTYAKAALTKAGLWERVQAKIHYEPTIKDCYKILSAGKADAGFAYIGCPIPADPAKAEYSKVKTAQVLEESLYGGAIAYASVLKDAPHAQAAKSFVDFVTSPKSEAVLAGIGLRCVAAD